MSSSTVFHPISFDDREIFELNDPVLVKIASGDATAVDECLDQYGSMVWSMVRKWFKNTADAEDITQEIFLDLWQCAKKFNPQMGSESTFIATIARRRMIDRIRKNNAKLGATSLEFAVIEPTAAVMADPIELADEAAKASRCFEKLSSDQRRILRLSIDQGISHGAIAETLKIPLGTVKTFARRGLIALRECMRRGESDRLSGSLT